MAAVAHHLLAAVAVASLSGAALRLANMHAPAGIERVLAAVAFGATAAVLEALALGLAKLADKPVALAGAAAATWLAASRVLPAPAVRPSRELSMWLRERSRGEWLALATAVGIGCAWLAWWIWRPAVGADSVQYHLPEIIAWIHAGDIGAVHDLHGLYPIGNYPVTNEVLTAWSLGIARSFAPLPLLSLGAVLLLVVAGLSGLRALGVSRLVAALAVGAVVASPLLVAQTIGPNTDLPSLAWLVCCASLVASSRRNPLLLAPAVAAAGLALGTKTTPALFVAVVVAAGLWPARGEWRRLRTPLALATAAAVGAGGVWYLRNLLDHGSPFWPFFGGDAAPSFVERTSKTGLIERPRATLDGQARAYEKFLAGALLLIPAALAAALLVRTRVVAAAAALTAAGLALWTTAPFTGVPADVPAEWLGPLRGLAVNATRYLLPVIAAAALTLALSSRRGGRATVAAAALLAAALAWDVFRVAKLSNAAGPPAAVLVGGGVVGALAGTVLRRAWVPARPPRFAVPVALVVAVAALSLAADGYVKRHAQVELRFLPGYEGVIAQLDERDDFRDGDRTVATAPVVLGTLAGDRLRHPVELIPEDEPCGRIRERARTQWVVVYQGGYFEPYTARDCFAGAPPAISVGEFRVYGGGR